MNKLYALSLLVATSIALVGAQQEQQPTLQLQTTKNCSVVTTKPTTEVKKYAFKSCIVAQFGAYLTIGEGKYINLINGTVNQNQSVCNNATVQPILMIDFDCAQLQFSINHSNDSRTYVSAINGLFGVNGTQTPFTNTSQNFVTTLSGHYYKCNSQQSIKLDKPELSLEVDNFALEAYRDASGTDFYQVPEECPLDSQPVSDLVRIGVGICLVALVAIVLVAYFIGRRRWSERSSYESV